MKYLPYQLVIAGFMNHQQIRKLHICSDLAASDFTVITIVALGDQVLLGHDVFRQVATDHSLKNTPGKINMETDNTGPLEKEKHLNPTIIFRFYVSSWGVYRSELDGW